MTHSGLGLTKYIIHARFEVEGVVEKPDVIGAIFGQTEGLFGNELDLRELQKSGRIGRIEINLSTAKDRTKGTISIPSTLDRVSVALIAAAIESIDRIGPCNAQVILEKIEDVRDVRRKAIIERAKAILKDWEIKATSSLEDTLKELLKEVKYPEIASYGSEGLPAGPDVETSDSIIIVEGRADVLNLLRCGLRNVVAVEGVKVPESIIELTKKKREVTALLDGDRGGDLILKELLQVARLDYVARAPQGMEVEELTPAEVLRALERKVPVKQIRGKPDAVGETLKGTPLAEPLLRATLELQDTLEAIIFDERFNPMARIPVSELAERLKDFENAKAIVFDGIITQRLVDIAEEKGVGLLLGARISDITKKPEKLQLKTFSEVLGAR
ncbi:DNA primase [Candidatus Bathyarchaeota archaeon]|nr:DNA primase [Candidatus Bathyarchaeota archaeon]MBS7628016.1 DNA primase [Candidatus Bathyarchaeota archaeon]